jgi:quercetin dioxygenase-like cupin family protein
MPEGSLSRPPESFRPDRIELVSQVGARPPAQLVPGVHMDCLVGQYNGARRLTTGLVEFAPSARLPYHTHSVSESVTILKGAALACVEGRQYRLGVMDNIVIPRGIAHSVRNLSATEAARFHVAFPSEAPGREWVTSSFKSRPMPGTSSGTPGKERVNRFATAPRSSAGPGTSFIDFFNEELMPGLEMSGGYGRFRAGGRLPAHFHDFDESICIIEGMATCICEGRRYAMSGGATALQPRGRVHYFINESNEPMAMLWVYGGPRPDRMLAAEDYATGERDPWPA